jgi:hypothetical protein
VSDQILNRDTALTAAREELTQDADTVPTLRDLLDHLSEAKWQSILAQAELRDSLSGFDCESPVPPSQGASGKP